MANVLIAYFSRAGENYFSGQIKKTEIGNGEKVVNYLLEKLDADVFRIEMETPYPDDYIECTELAQADLKNDVRPALKKYLDDLGKYEKVIIVYPNYWGSVPMAVWSFGENLSWAGTTVMPICTSEGSGFGNSVSAIKKICRGAIFETGLSLIGGEVDNSGAAIDEWLSDKGLI